MVPDWFLTVVTIGVLVMALAMLVQMGTMLALYLAVRRTQEMVQNVVDRQVQPILTQANSIAGSAKTIVESAQKQVEELGLTVRAQVARIDQVVTEATDRARLQVIRADEMVTDTLGRMERTVDAVETGILKPVREARAVVQGIGTAMGHLKRKRGPNDPERVTQDEEMFI